MGTRTRRLLAATLVVAAIASLATSCGGDDGSGGTASDRTTSPTRSTTTTGATPSTPSGCGTTGLPTTVRYRTIPGVAANLTSLDVWVPAGACDAPVVVWVHGGGYRGGDKRNQLDDKRALFGAKGWILVSVNYRLTDGSPTGARYPDHYEDVAAALAWVHDHVASYGGDPARVAVAGHSAGADIVANVVAEPRYLAAHGLTATEALRCLAPLDTEGFDKVTASDDAEDVLWQRALGNDPDYATHTSATLLTQAGGPVVPTLGVYRGTAQRQAIERAYLDAVAARGVRTVAVDARSLTHAEVNNRIGAPGDTVVTPPLVAFLGTCLR
jgi:acetyl esterase/lipase